MSVPEQTDSGRFFHESEHHQIKLDGVFWKNDDYHFGGDWSDRETVYAETTALGQCTKENLCQHPSDFLLELTFSALGQPWFVTPSEVGWFVLSSEEEKRVEMSPYIGFLEHHGQGFRSGTVSKAMDCFSENDDLVFGVLSTVPEGFDWTVAKDSELQECRIEKGEEEGYFSSSIITPLDGTCGTDDKLSGAAIAGIAIGVAIFLVVAFCVGSKLLVRNRSVSSFGVDDKQTGVR